MSWYSTGAQAADEMAASTVSRRRRNFYTKPGEGAVIRFLSPATKGFNYKRCFVKWAKGEKMLTSPGGAPDPFEAAGLQLQVSTAWLILDRRVLKFNDKQTGEEKEIGPRVLYFADGTRTRKQLQAFEQEMLAQENEERSENGLELLTLEQFNLTSYDLKASKETKAPWNFVAKRPKPLSKADQEIIEKGSFDLMEELKPLPLPEIQAILKGHGPAADVDEDDDETTTGSYSYSDDDDDTIKFD